MKCLFTLILTICSLTGFGQEQAKSILEKVDLNMSANSRVFESTMTIHGKRNSRSITSRSYVVGSQKSFTEYLSPPREQGTKMLKLEEQLWIYSPSTDRTIQISGHMLRQSVMGSDLSYEDMMEDRKLTEIYNSKITGQEQIGQRKTWVLELTAKTDDIAYATRKLWVDTERYIPLKEELYAKSGKLLKQSVMSDVERVGERWFPKTIFYKDMLKQGSEGTEFQITKIQFDTEIPEHLFTKAALKL